jgi:glycosyltransferase involved in cell wall biosynthesis
MKILIVTAFFPPQNSIASLRPYSWAKWWSRAGHDVTVLTTVKSKNENDLLLDCSGFEIIALPLPFFSSASSAYHSVNKNRKSIKKILILFARNLYYLFAQKTGCFSACRFPDFHDPWAKNAAKKIKTLQFDMVISSGGPYSVHRVGLALKKKHPETKWVVDWRDLWTRNHIYPGLSIFWHHEKALEKKFHQNADLITTVSEPLADIVRSMTNTRAEVIYNGYDPDDYGALKQNPRKTNDIFTIAYTGTIYRGFRNVSPLFEAVSHLKKRNIISQNDLRIVFAGANADVGDIAESYNVSEFYSYLGFLPREDALQLQYDADALLFLEYNDPNVPGILTGKLFEYLYIAREIIAVGIDETTAAGKLIKDTQAGLCFGTNIEEIEKYLIARIVSKETNALEKSIGQIEVFARKNQAMKLLGMIK